MYNILRIADVLLYLSLYLSMNLYIALVFCWSFGAEFF